MKRRRQPPAFDPVKTYDGLCQLGAKRVTPEEMTEFAKQQMAIMEDSHAARLQDEEARRTPVGEMQFRNLSQNPFTEKEIADRITRAFDPPKPPDYALGSVTLTPEGWR